jgi:hypothetical protein
MIGFKKLIGWIIYRLFVLEKVILYKMERVNDIKSIATVKIAKMNNIEDAQDFQEEKQLSTFKTFIKEGQVGYFGYIQERCIHRSWVVIRENSIVNLHFLIKRKLYNNEVFIHYCETAPEARGQNVYPYVISVIAKNYRDKDVLICVNKKNVSSIKGVIKAGFKPVETFTVVAIFGFVLKFRKILKGVD